MKTELKGAIFDVDGTLTDSMGIWDTMGSDFVKSMGATPPEGLDVFFRTLTVPEVGVYFHESLGLGESAEAICEGINSRVRGFYEGEVTEKPGALDFLKRLRDRGVKMCVATANERPMIVSALRHCGMLDYFEFIMTCTETGMDKNTPDFYLAAAKRLGTAVEDTVVFEDMLHAVRSAKAGGFRTVGMYDAVSVKYGKEVSAEADVYIRDYRELEV